jgi:ribulose 1,5-bisphosphate synthetase/thiazole synthase
MTERHLRQLYSHKTHLSLNMQSIDVDVLVCGGGMSGMACASFSVQSGARVQVVEKQSTIGGSSSYSAGMLYPVVLYPSSRLFILMISSQGPQTYKKLRSWVPGGDPEL